MEHFQLIDTVDIIWFTCSTIGLCILIVVICIFIKILQNIYCIPEPAQRVAYQPKNVNTYATLSALFATLNATVDFSTYFVRAESAYFVCAEWECYLNPQQWIYDILIGTCYTLAKVFLYVHD